MISLSVRPSDTLRGKIQQLSQLQEGFGAKVNAQVRESAIAVVAYATELVPVSSGMLRDDFQSPLFVGTGANVAARIGSSLPYAAKQEFDLTLNHSLRVARTRQRDTLAGKKGSVIKGTNQDNPEAQAMFLTTGLGRERTNFLSRLQDLVNEFGAAWEGTS